MPRSPQFWHQLCRANTGLFSNSGSLIRFHAETRRSPSLTPYTNRVSPLSPRLPSHFNTYLPAVVSPPVRLVHNSDSLRIRMSLRCPHSTKATKTKSHFANGNGSANPNHEPNQELENSHTHSHSLFSSHSHGEQGYNHGAEKIMAALEGAGDRGSQITLVGLFANIGLTAAKGVAGWCMHSASLLADAGHSLSDLLGDFVTLFCWRLSRAPPSERYPYGFAKFETIGTTTISLLLIGGALGIGFHSYHLLITALSETASILPMGPLQTALQNVTSVAPAVPIMGHSHMHAVDPNAAWFAAVSVLIKEWLYRVTKNVADAEKSPVLLANAIHHRSDAYSSVVALIAILGTWIFPALPLDPIGGLLVSIVILRQGLSLLAGAWSDLTDASVSPKTQQTLTRTLDPMVITSSPLSSPTQPHGDDHIPTLLGIRQFRARRAGSLIFVDLTADVSGMLNMHEASSLEHKIVQTLKEARKEITDVRVKFNPVDIGHCGESRR